MARQRDNAADSNAQQSPQADSPVFSPISGSIRFVWRCLTWLLLSIFFGTFFDWLGMLAGWWGSDHSLTVLSQDIAWLGENFTTSILDRSPADVALAAPYMTTSLSTSSRHHATASSSRLPNRPRLPCNPTGRA